MTASPESGRRGRRRALLLMVAGALTLGLASTACQDAAPVDPTHRTLRIAVVPKGTNMAFWRTVHAGALKAERDLGARGIDVEVIWKGPLREDDREQQIQVVEDFTSQKVDGIVLAPLDARALVRPVEEAKRLGIPIVIFDSGLDSEDIVSFVATDNYKGGEMAADAMGRLLDGKGKRPPAPLSGGLGQHHRPGGGLPGPPRQRLARDRGHLLEPARRPHPGHRKASGGEPAQPLRNRPRRRLRRQRDVHPGHAPRPPGHAGSRGRSASSASTAHRALADAVRARRDGRLRAPGPVRHGRARGRDHGRPPPRQARSPRVDTGVLVVTHGQPRRAPRPRPLLHPPLDEYLPATNDARSPRIPASPSASGPRWPSTASTSRCGPARSTRWSARTARARAR